MPSPRLPWTTAAFAAILSLPSGCGAPTASHLSPQQEWFGDNRERIDALFDEVAASQQRKVAVLDWDNTMIKNDVGDAVLFWMLGHDKVLRPSDWAVTSGFLTTPAREALAAACDGLTDVGQPLPTSRIEGTGCADEIVTIYTTGATVAGDDAFAGWNYRTMEPAYAWTVQLQTGHTLDDLRGFADQAIDAGLAADEGAEQTIGSVSGLNAYLRLYAQMEDLVATLHANEFDVWVLSASSQPIVEAFAARVGIAADHVIGVRAIIDGAGRTTSDVRGCGSVADGDNTLIPYIEGKRCWMNKVIFEVAGAAAHKVQTDPALRPLFAAGDSDTDISFLQDTTGLRLVVNRNKGELMCNAYHDAGDNWIVNPMFLAPKPRLEDGYACSVDACKDADGVGTPCLDELGERIPNQEDTVFCADAVYCTK